MKKLTYEFVKEYMESFDYVLLSKEYTGAKQKLLVKCPNENHQPYETNWGRFKRGGRCPYCNLDNRKVDINYIREYANQIGYILKSTDYKNNSQKLEFICPKGHTTFISWGNFNKGRRCSECYCCKKLTDKEVSEYLNKFGYKLNSKYENANTKINIICPEGHEYTATYGHFYNGKRCPYCKSSNGEARIANYLNKNNIEFKKEYVIKTNEKMLRLDFYIEDINLAIEYDGQQHYKPIEKFGGQEEFEKTIYRDGLKDKYCNDNNIQLIRIPYYDFNNIENILDNLFKK